MEKDQNLTRIAVGGTSWLLGSGLAIQAFALLAQIVLGRLLTEDDFGLYALAIGVTACLQVFRDGGVSLWLARKPRDAFDNAVSQAFWLCLACSLLIAIALALIAPVAARVYRETTVCWMIVIVAISLPLDAYGVIVEADLQVGLRFRTLAFFRVVGPWIRYALSVLLAWRGWGPMSFVLPLIPVALVRSVHGYTLTRFAPQQWPSWGRMRTIFGESRWVFSGTFASSLFRQVDYLVMGLLATVATVGIYFFAFQLAVQPVLLFGQSLRRVLIPTISLAGSDAERRLRAIVRSAAFIGLIASVLFLLFALLAPTIERVLWRGNWQVAVPAMQWLAAAMPLQLFALLTRMIAQADGRFRLWGAAVLGRSVGLGLTVLGAATAWPDRPTHIASAVALYLASSSIVEATFVLRRLGIVIRPVLEVVVPPYVFTVVVAVVCGSLVKFVSRSQDLVQLSVSDSVLAACLFVGVCSVGAFALFPKNVDHIWSVRRSVSRYTS